MLEDEKLVGGQVATRMKEVLLIFLALTLSGCAAAARPELDVPSSPGLSSEAASGADAPEAAAAGPRIEKPPTFQKGYKLTFRSRTSDYDMTYKGQQDGLLAFHVDTREKLPFDRLYTPDLKLAGITNAQDETRFDPPIGYVDFPLYVGKKWFVPYKFASNTRRGMGDVTVEVVAFEPVRVPYGTVDAFRIQVRNHSREMSRMNSQQTYWYSPEIGYFVKLATTKPVYEDPYELIAVSN